MRIFRTYTIHAARSIPTLKDDHICKNLHGHTFKIAIEIDGDINEVGFVMDFYDLDIIVKDVIVNKIDHKNLNSITGLANPSSEYLSIWIWDKLLPHVPGLYQVTVSEDNGTGVKYKGK